MGETTWTLKMRQDFSSVTYSFVITFKLSNFSVLVALVSNAMARFISLPFIAFCTHWLSNPNMQISAIEILFKSRF